jgi:hypothetical protein
MSHVTTAKVIVVDDFERLYLDGPEAINEAIANAWTEGVTQERERILGELNRSGVLEVLPGSKAKSLLDLVMKIA